MITAEQAREQSRDNAKIHAELSMIEKDITNSCQMGEFEVCVYNGKYKMKISWIR